MEVNKNILYRFDIDISCTYGMAPAKRIILVLRLFPCWFIEWNISWHGIWLVPIVRGVRFDNNLAFIL